MEGKDISHHPPCVKAKFCYMQILQTENLLFPYLREHPLMAFELQNRGRGE